MEKLSAWVFSRLGFLLTLKVVCCDEESRIDVKLGFGSCKSAGSRKINSLLSPFPCPGRREERTF